MVRIFLRCWEIPSTKQKVIDQKWDLSGIVSRIFDVWKDSVELQCLRSESLAKYHWHCDQDKFLVSVPTWSGASGSPVISSEVWFSLPYIYISCAPFVWKAHLTFLFYSFGIEGCSRDDWIEWTSFWHGHCGQYGLYLYSSRKWIPWATIYPSHARRWQERSILRHPGRIFPILDQTCLTCNVTKMYINLIFITYTTVLEVVAILWRNIGILNPKMRNRRK